MEDRAAVAQAIIETSQAHLSRFGTLPLKGAPPIGIDNGASILRNKLGYQNAQRKSFKTIDINFLVYGIGLGDNLDDDELRNLLYTSLKPKFMMKSMSNDKIKGFDEKSMEEKVLAGVDVLHTVINLSFLKEQLDIKYGEDKVNPNV